MKDSLFSPSWYRVAGLRPRLRSHTEIHRHTYRGELWYVLEDPVSGKYQRFTPSAHYIIGLMDGRRTVEEIWQAGMARFSEEAPTQEEVIHLLGQLHAADVLQSDVPPDTLELLQRFEKKQNVKWKQNIRSPMSMRFSLFDPDRFLTRFQGAARPLFGWAGGLVWAIVVAIGAIIAGVHWPELSKDVSDRILAPQNLILLWLIYPLLKALHEFGHAFAIKVLGGVVHELGIMFLVLAPVPYVDASSVNGFSNKWHRALVDAAGIGVELFVASLALMIWVNVEPGAFRSVLYNIIVIGGVSSILFNGNPLLRYDGYYVLADLLEIPNLGSRGTRYLVYLVERYLFGVRHLEPPLSSRGERVWFVLYTMLSFFYKIVIYIGIIQFIVGKFLTIGLLLAIWMAVVMFALPLYKGIRFLLSSPHLQHTRTRAFAVSGAALVTAGIMVFAVPFPLSTVSEGVLWLTEESVVRANIEGFVDRLVVPPGTEVKPGVALVECSDPLLPARVRMLEARLRELQVQYDMNERSERVKALVAMDDIKQIEGRLEVARNEVNELTMHSRSEGKFYVPTPQDLPGRYLKRGEIAGYVLSDASVAARVVVPQADVDLVRKRTQSVSIRLPERITVSLPATLVREVPGGTEQLPARVLGQAGGGSVAIDPRDEKGVRAYQKIFLFDVQLPPHDSLFNVGGRVYVRFDHGLEPLAWRWYRGVRQLLVKRFNV